jgi:hypothetical protein
MLYLTVSALLHFCRFIPFVTLENQVSGDRYASIDFDFVVAGTVFSRTRMERGGAQDRRLDRLPTIDAGTTGQTCGNSEETSRWEEDFKSKMPEDLTTESKTSGSFSKRQSGPI